MSYCFNGDNGILRMDYTENMWNYDRFVSNIVSDADDNTIIIDCKIGFRSEEVSSWNIFPWSLRVPCFVFNKFLAYIVQHKTLANV